MNIIPIRRRRNRRVLFEAYYGFRVSNKGNFIPIKFIHPNKTVLSREIKKWIQQQKNNPSYSDFLNLSLPDAQSHISIA